MYFNCLKCAHTLINYEYALIKCKFFIILKRWKIHFRLCSLLFDRVSNKRNIQNRLVYLKCVVSPFFTPLDIASPFGTLVKSTFYYTAALHRHYLTLEQIIILQFQFNVRCYSLKSTRGRLQHHSFYSMESLITKFILNSHLIAFFSLLTLSTSFLIFIQIFTKTITFIILFGAQCVSDLWYTVSITNGLSLLMISLAHSGFWCHYLTTFNMSTAMCISWFVYCVRDVRITTTVPSVVSPCVSSVLTRWASPCASSSRSLPPPPPLQARLCATQQQ